MWQPASGIVMNNDIGDTNPEEAAACIALYKNDSYVMSASGGKVSLFNMMTFKWFRDSLSVPISSAINSCDNVLVYVSFCDGAVGVFDALWFRDSLSVPISSAINSCDNVLVYVSFCDDAVGVFDAENLRLHCRIAPSTYLPSGMNSNNAYAFSSAIYSCDNVLLFASFCDGAVGVFDAESLKPHCRIAPSAYLPSGINSGTAYPFSSAIYSCDRVLVYASFCDGAVGVSFCDGAVGVFDAESLRPHCRIAPSAYLPSVMDNGQLECLMQKACKASLLHCTFCIFTIGNEP